MFVAIKDRREKKKQKNIIHVKIQLQAKFLMAGCFVVYATTYTMPTLMPFMVSCSELGVTKHQERRETDGMACDGVWHVSVVFYV